MQEMRFSTLYPRAMHYFATRTAHPMPPSSKHDLDSTYQSCVDWTGKVKRIYRPLPSPSPVGSTVYHSSSFAPQLEAEWPYLYPISTRPSICRSKVVFLSMMKPCLVHVLEQQCVIHLGQDFAEYRGRISQQFEDIRSSVMNAQARHNVPKLAEHHIKW